MTLDRRGIDRLLAVMAQLRDPQEGCPWDVTQTFDSIAPYTIEEACEVADAITRGDMVDLKDELGDLLLQVVFHARMAEERSLFDFGDVVEAIVGKMVRRHPHVFGEAKGRSRDEVNRAWEEIKRDEKAERARERAALGLADDASQSVLDGVPAALPALVRAIKLQNKASGVGFDWNDARQVLAKIREECDELERELESGDESALAGEVGDLLFAVANLARHARVDAESALRSTNEKFRRRFGYIEQQLRSCGKRPQDVSLTKMDALWDEAKLREGASNGKKPTRRSD